MVLRVCEKGKQGDLRVRTVLIVAQLADVSQPDLDDLTVLLFWQMPHQ